MSVKGEESMPAMSIGKAISIHGALNWPATFPGPEFRYLWPPFSANTHSLRRDNLQRLRAVGFDTIRLTVGLGIFLSADATKIDLLDEIVRDRIQRILDDDLNVILDFHPITQDPRYPPDTFTEDPDAPNAIALRNLESRMARLLSAFPLNRVALEILNEPATKAYGTVSARNWDKTQKQYYEAVRAAAPSLTIILSGCCACCNRDLAMINPDQYDGNTYYTFHVYSPHPFTMQLLNDPKRRLNPGKFIGAVQFPMSGEALTVLETKARAALSATDIPDLQERLQATRSLERAIGQLKVYGTVPAINLIFDDQIEWANRHNISTSRLFLGEFGVQRPGVDEESRKLWLETVRIAAETRGIPWAYWSFERPEYMGLALDRTGNQLDSIVLRALGLKAP